MSRKKKSVMSIGYVYIYVYTYIQVTYSVSWLRLVNDFSSVETPEVSLDN
jgi:hypothetical protein